MRLIAADAGAALAGNRPFGLAFDGEGAAWCVLFSPGATTVPRLLDELPVPPTGTLVLLLPELARRPGLLGRLARPEAVPLAIRCTALLARGFTNVGGGVEPTSGLELAWGIAP
jgi:hypothetical protein